jgi:adenylate cyclase
MIIHFSGPRDPRGTFTAATNSVLVGRVLETNQGLDLYPDMRVSHHHALIAYDGSNYWVEDRNSRNGTWVNGQRIAAKTKLNVGDVILVGETRVEVVVPPELEEHPPAGDLTSTVIAAEPKQDLIIPQEKKPGMLSLVAVRRRLAAFYELDTALSTLQAFGQLANVVNKHVQQAIPGAERCGLFLREGDELVFNGSLPESNTPTASRSLLHRAIEKREAFTWRIDESLITAMLTTSLSRHGTQAAMYAPLVWKDEIQGVLYVDNTSTPDAFEEGDLRLMLALANQVGMYVKNHALQAELHRSELVRANLLRHFSPKVAERLIHELDERGSLWLGGRAVNPVTILVTDVREVQELTDELRPDELVLLLNDMFSALVPIIFKYDGTVDKYVSDSIIAVFGSPEPDDNQWFKAASAALEMQQAMRALADSWRMRRRSACEIAIGIHTGEAIHGFLGSPERMEYTLVGETVDIASRYCNGAGGGEILISPQVYLHVAYLVDTGPEMPLAERHPRDESNLMARLVIGLKA